MAETNTLAVAARERAGKGPARAERRAGRIPAIIYGGNTDPVMISVEPRDLQREMNAGNLFSTVYTLKPGGKTERVLPREIQYHPVTDRALHVDFLRVTASTKLSVEVPCNFINEDNSPGLRRGGVLNVVRYSIELICRVDEIPNQIDIDLTGLEIGEGVHISSVNLTGSAEPAISDRDFTIATIAAPTVISEEAQSDEEDEQSVDADTGVTSSEDGSSEGSEE